MQWYTSGKQILPKIQKLFVLVSYDFVMRGKSWTLIDYIAAIIIEIGKLWVANSLHIAAYSGHQVSPKRWLAHISYYYLLYIYIYVPLYKVKQ